MSTQVIILNSDFSFLNTVSWQKAITLMFKSEDGTPVVEVVGNKFIKTVKTASGAEYKVPKVLRLINFVRNVFKRKVPYSKKNIMARDNNMCQFSGCTNKAENIDHVVPRALGGKSSWENCVAACKECNNKKGSLTLKQAGMSLKKRPIQPTISEYVQFKLKKMGIKDLIKEIMYDYTNAN